MGATSNKTWNSVDASNEDTIVFNAALSSKTGDLDLVFTKGHSVSDPLTPISSPETSPKVSKKTHKKSTSTSSSDEEVTTTAKPTIISKPNLLNDWVDSGLIKTDPIAVKDGQTLTVTCEFDEATEVTEISFINSAQNAYYPGGVTVQPGEKKATFTSVVPTGDTQTWLVIRHPSFNGTDKLALGVTLTDLNIEIKD